MSVRVNGEFRFAPPFFAVPVAFDALWRDARWIAIGGVHVTVPATQDLLVIPCIQAAASSSTGRGISRVA